jgi:hypothetical protein
MQLNLLVIAQSAVIDQATNNLSIFGIFEQITASGFPIAVPMTIVLHVSRKKAEKPSQDARIVLTLNGSKIGEQRVTIEFQDKFKSRLIATVQPVVIERPGALTVSMFQRKTCLESWPVNILQVAQVHLGAPSQPTSRCNSRSIGQQPEATEERVLRQSLEAAGGREGSGSVGHRCPLLAQSGHPVALANVCFWG